MKKPAITLLALMTWMSSMALALPPQEEARRLAANMNGNYTLIEASGDHAKQYCVSAMQVSVTDTGVEVTISSDKDAPLAVTYNTEAPPIKEGLMPIRRGAFNETSLRQRQDSGVRSIELDLASGRLTKRSFAMTDLYRCVYQKNP